MLNLSAQTRVFVYGEAMDMRCSFERLVATVRQVLVQDPVSGHLFVFLNRPRTHVKILFWDRSGFVIWYKRLERGTFSRSEKSEIEVHELLCMLEGIELEKKMQKKRYYFRKTAA